MGHGAHSQRRCGASGPGVAVAGIATGSRSPLGQTSVHDQRCGGSGACVGDQLNQDGEPCGIRLLWVVCYGLSVMPAVRSGSGLSVRLPAKLTLASVMVCPCLLPGRAVCPALGTGGRWTPWHAAGPPGASGGTNEVGWLDELPSGLGSGAGLVGGRLRLGVGHARNRPARSLHPGHGGRTRLPPREPLAGPSQAPASS
jgi:hypothetical protein